MFYLLLTVVEHFGHNLQGPVFDSTSPESNKSCTQNRDKWLQIEGKNSLRTTRVLEVCYACG